tara:strand:+ start:1089 stop:1265 length:177 start_codon:yes stop_codon:yes gene_type:complete
MGASLSSSSKIADKSLNQNLLTNELLNDILKRIEFIEDKIWCIDNKLEYISKQINSKS